MQEASHGAGQTRPVNSGKLLVRVQVARRLLPVAAIDQIVPVRDLVVHRAAVVTEGDAAIHAARGLVARRLLARAGGRIRDNGGCGRTPARSAGPPGRFRGSRSPCPSLRHSPRQSNRSAPTRPARLRAHSRRQHPHGSAPPARRARGGIRPASPCGTSAGRPPSSRGFPARGSSRCSARGWRSAGAGARRRSGVMSLMTSTRPWPSQIAAGMVVALHRVLLLGRDRLQIDHRQVAALGEVARLVEHIGDAARHAGGEVAAGLADAPRRCRRSCIRSHDRRRPRPRRSRRNCARRSARRRRRGSSIRRRSRRRARCCRR